MIELNKIYNEDCLEGMKRIPDGSVDCVCCDLPYGTIKGCGLSGWNEETTKWDVQLDIDAMFEQYERVLRMNGVAILFSQEPYTSVLRTYKPRNMSFIYPLIYLKNNFGSGLSAKKAPVSYFEDISVFVKDYDTQCLHPLRGYFSEVLMFIGKTRTEINKELGDRTAEHCFYVEAKKAVKKEIGGAADHTFRNGSSQFSLCIEATYNKLIALFGIDKMQGYKSYNELQEINRAFSRTFNIPKGKITLVTC